MKIRFFLISIYHLICIMYTRQRVLYIIHTCQLFRQNDPNSTGIQPYSFRSQTFVSFLCGGTLTVNTRSLMVNRKSSSMSDSIVLEDAMRTPSELDTTTRSTPWSSVFNMLVRSPTVFVTGRNVN